MYNNLKINKDKEVIMVKALILVISILALSSNVTARERVPKALVIDEVNNRSQELLCDRKETLHKCFKISPQECSQTASISTDICLSMLADEMPEYFYRSDVQYWEKKISFCMVETAVNLVSEKLDTTKCRKDF